jgi:hypothetical protein
VLPTSPKTEKSSGAKFELWVRCSHPRALEAGHVPRISFNCAAVRYLYESATLSQSSTAPSCGTLNQPGYQYNNNKSW